ncbi:MAG: Fe-S cluster assembly protein SufD [Gammaproteobacteria bacterium]|nr:Fe-S cluster assembly protein SufD [Gammaproteobacteria bacterium]
MNSFTMSQALVNTRSSLRLMPVRRAALEQFIAHGLPTSHEEDWKYTSLGHLEKTEWHTPEGAPIVSNVVLGTEEYPGEVMHFSNGHLNEASPQACYARSLAKQADSAPVVQHLDTLTRATALTQLNSALWQDGLFLHVSTKDTSADASAPLFAVYSAGEAGAMLHLRNLIVLEAGAEMLLVEHYRGTPDLAYWNNPVTEIVLGEGARLTHLKLTEDSAAATHTGLTVVQQARDSCYRALSVNLGGRLLRQDVEVNLMGDGAECRLDGLFIADARRHIDQHLHIEHAASHTTSRQAWRGIAAGRGRGIFDARVVVQPDAQHADAQQASANLLLSPHAEIDVKPQLEIYTNDVQCGHGAAVGQLDEAQIFYLRSRGISADVARALLLRGFADAALGLLKDTGLAEWLEPHLTAALPRLEQERAA